MLCKLFRGYLFRKAFLANSIVFMDVYLPEGPKGDVIGKDKNVEVVGDFTEDPWDIEIKCAYSEFFKAYTATIPVIDGSLFKFLVDGEYITSSDHPTKYDPETQTYNNVVTIYHYIFDSESGHKKKRFISNALSLSNPAIRETVLCKFTLLSS